jgi:hypothetical protein
MPATSAAIVEAPAARHRGAANVRHSALHSSAARRCLSLWSRAPAARIENNDGPGRDRKEQGPLYIAKANRDKLAISGREKIEADDQMENIADLVMPIDQNRLVL